MRILLCNAPGPARATAFVVTQDGAEGNNPPSRVVRLDGTVGPSVPLQRHFKFGEWYDCPNDPALLRKLGGIVRAAGPEQGSTRGAEPEETEI